MAVMLSSACTIPVPPTPKYHREQRIAELENQIVEQAEVIRRLTSERDAPIAERKARLDKATAIESFANEAIKLQSELVSFSGDWVAWYMQSVSWYPSEEATEKLAVQSVEHTAPLTSKIENVYAPTEAKEIKRSLLLQADKLSDSFGKFTGYFLPVSPKDENLFRSASEL